MRIYPLGVPTRRGRGETPLVKSFLTNGSDWFPDFSADWSSSYIKGLLGG